MITNHTGNHVRRLENYLQIVFFFLAGYLKICVNENIHNNTFGHFEDYNNHYEVLMFKRR